MNARGQASYEILLLTAVVFLASIVILSGYLTPMESFRIAAQTRLSTIEELSRTGQPGYVESIEWQETATEYCLRIQTNPAPLNTAALGRIQSKVAPLTPKNVRVISSTQTC
ncbi:MAG: hypothetical protein HY917_00020 [Candidatus Diapherotrites archaeon]|nr:hypothetical protein [Candidatus Diapherotrites archaeon]